MSFDRLLLRGIRTRVPLFLLGSPGIGKTSLVTDFCRRMHLHLEVVIASLREPTDFAGLPVVSKEPIKVNGTDVTCVHLAPPKFAIEALRHGGVLFFDELPTAAPSVQAALLRGIQELCFGELQLDPHRVTVLAAGNPTEEGAASWDLAAPLAGRFRHRKINVDPQAWVDRFPSYWDSPPVLAFEGVKTLPESAWMQARTLVAGYIRVKPSSLFQMPKDESARGGPWPSPRTFDYASRMIAEAIDAGEPPTEASQEVEDCIGSAAAMEMMSWIKNADLPDPFELLANPKKFKMPKRSDIQYVVLRSVAEAARSVIKKGNTEKERNIWDAACSIMTTAGKEGAIDVGVVAVKELLGKYNTDLTRPAEMLSLYRPMLQSAGILHSNL